MTRTFCPYCESDKPGCPYCNPKFEQELKHPQRYPNGDVIKAERIEEEPWYPDYQNLLELTIGLEKPSVAALHQEYLEEYRAIYGNLPSREHFEQSLRWAVLHVERHRQT